MKNNLNIPTRFRQLRAERGLTQIQVAHSLNISRGQYASYEEGNAEPSLRLAIKMAEFYGFNSLDGLFNVAPLPKQPLIVKQYNSATLEKRNIVDYILSQ